MPEKNPAISISYAGKNHTQVPAIPGVPEFADVAQVLVFKNEEDAKNYEFTQAHLDLRKATDEYVAKVACAEFRQ